MRWRVCGVCRCRRVATISDRERADRHVHVEDPAPGEAVDEEAAEQRPRDRGDSEHGADQAHVAAALPRRDDVGDDRLRADHQPAGADPLQRAEADQLAHRLREPGEHRAGEEDQDRRQEDRLAPDHVAELAVERRRDRRGEQVRGHDPREVVEAAEVADDRRQRGRDDRLVERGQEHAEHQRDEDRPQGAPGGTPVGGRVHRAPSLRRASQLRSGQRRRGQRRRSLGAHPVEHEPEEAAPVRRARRPRSSRSRARSSRTRPEDPRS